MYSSLDRVDIVLKPGPDGRRRLLQSDHRTAAEIEQEPAISTLFALIRVLNPRRMVEDGSPEPLVIYVAQQRPPRFLRQVIHAAGAQLTLSDDLQPEPPDGPPLPLDEVVASAFRDLARAVATEHGVELSLEGLDTLETRLAESAGDPEEDEIAYWSAVVKLGGFAGELIRASNGGRWTVVDSGTLPLALQTRFRGEEATVNPLGKAIKRFANGEEDSLTALVRLLQSQP